MRMRVSSRRDTASQSMLQFSPSNSSQSVLYKGLHIQDSPCR